MTTTPEIEAAIRNERERIARQFEADADLCGNINSMVYLQRAAKSVREMIPNSYTDHSDECSRNADGVHTFEQFCSSCGLPHEHYTPPKNIILDNDQYMESICVVDRLENRCIELEKEIAALKDKLEQQS